MEKPRRKEKFTSSESTSTHSSAVLVPGFDADFDEIKSGETILKVNMSYKRRFEAQERKRELSYLESKNLLAESHNDDDQTTSSESEDEAELANNALDLQMAKVIQCIRSKDPKIYDHRASWFAEDNELERHEKKQDRTGGAGGGGEGRKNSSKVRYKDVVRQQILEDAEAVGYARPNIDGVIDGKDEPPGDRRTYAYDDEQKRLRADFLKSAGDVSGDSTAGSVQGNSDTANDADTYAGNDGDDGVMDDCGLVVRKRKSNNETDDAGPRALAACLAPSSTADATDKYLEDYVLNERWRDKSGSFSSDDDDDADLEAVEQMDSFESKYNFRYEEEEAASAAIFGGGNSNDKEEDNGGALDGSDADGKQGNLGVISGALGGVSFNRGLSVRTYSRVDAPGTLRRKDEKRKNDRAARRERKAAEKEAKKNELRRLRNLKRMELAAKLSEIEAIAGFNAAGDANMQIGKQQQPNVFEDSGDHEEDGGGDFSDCGDSGTRSRKNQRGKLEKRELNGRAERQGTGGMNRGGDIGSGALASIFAEMGEDLDGDFDPESFDRIMKRAFGDEYYDAEEHAPEEIRSVATLSEEEGADDFVEGRERERKKERKMEGGGIISSSSSSLTRHVGVALKRADREIIEAKRLARDMAALEVYGDFNMNGGDRHGNGEDDGEGKCDGDDGISGPVDRAVFRYASVPKEDYGLSAEEILAADDKLLSSYVPLKKLAPYRQISCREVEDNSKALGRKRKRFREELRRRAVTKTEVKIAEALADQRRNNSGAGGNLRTVGGQGGEGEDTSGGSGVQREPNKAMSSNDHLTGGRQSCDAGKAVVNVPGGRPRGGGRKSRKTGTLVSSAGGPSAKGYQTKEKGKQKAKRENQGGGGRLGAYGL